jgi:UDP-GlcNAc:undecaprenyl-phosphate GlcNAc-1-phosphate transferase
VPFYQGGKDHVSHRLVAQGWTQREAVFFLYLACGALGVLAMFLTTASVEVAYVVGACVLGVAAWGLWRLEQMMTR